MDKCCKLSILVILDLNIVILLQIDIIFLLLSSKQNMQRKSLNTDLSVMFIQNNLGQPSNPVKNIMWKS